MAAASGVLAAGDDPELAGVALSKRAARLLHGRTDLVADDQSVTGGAGGFTEHATGPTPSPSFRTSGEAAPIRNPCWIGSGMDPGSPLRCARDDGGGWQ